MTGIALYVEGGGDSEAQKSRLRDGLDEALSPQKNAARLRKILWKTVRCGGRNATFHAFANATEKQTADYVLLVVDAEKPVVDNTPSGRLVHLKACDGWNFESVDESRVHLMTQCMEAWIVADPDRLGDYYGQGFRKNALPKRQVLDEEPKASLLSSLDAATKKTKKGPYGKITHASEVLKRLRPGVVSARCVSFQQLTQWLDATIEGA